MSEVEKRRRKAGDLKGIREQRTLDAPRLQLREADDGDVLRLSGYASVTETPYEVAGFEETIKRNAFKRTLAEEPDVCLLVGHEGLPLARTRGGSLRLVEDERGLRVDADLDPSDADVQRLATKMRNRLIDGMSFGFRVTDDKWSDDWTKRSVQAVNLHRGDISVCTYGANPAAQAALRAQQGNRGLSHEALSAQARQATFRQRQFLKRCER
jgi:HK97 family phage prohead protease